MEAHMSFRRVVSLLLLAAYLPACTSFRPAPEPLTALNAGSKPVKQVRVVTTNGAQIDVNAPRVANDTLFGTTWMTGPGGKQVSEAVAISVADLRTVEVRRSDGGKTALLIGGIVVGMILLSAAGCSDSDYGC
jgi:hypothetical protein